MNKKLLLPAMMLAVAFASCNNEENPSTGLARTALGVNVHLEEMSRAMVSGEALSDNDPIGVFVVESDYSPYDGKATGYSNVSYKGTTTSGSQKWGPSTTGTEILLSGTYGKAFAYYPYTEGINDYQAIPVDITLQKDWMYSGEEGPVNDAAPNVAFNLKHAQTAVNVKVVRDASYTGAGMVYALTVTSDGLATNGKLNAADGTFADVTGAGNAIYVNGSFTLVADNSATTDVKENEKENPYMFIPASTAVKNFTVNANIDGKPYKVDVTMTEAFKAGYIYKIAVKISNVGLTIDSVVIVEPWDETTLDDGTLVPGTGEMATIETSVNNDTFGYITGGGTYPNGTRVVLTAVPNENYEFWCWGDGSYENPRTVIATDGDTWSAIFKEKE